MKLPQMVSNVNKTKKYVVEFGGLNKNSRFREGELNDSLNLSSDLLPFISQRGKREPLGEFEAPTAIHAHNGIAVVDGTKFLYKADGATEFSEKIQVTAGKKQIVQMNSMIVVFPDKSCYDITNNKAYYLEGVASFVGAAAFQNTSNYSSFAYIEHNSIQIQNVPDSYGYPYENMSHNAGPYADNIYALFTSGDVVTLGRCMILNNVQNSASDSAYIGPITAQIKSITKSGDAVTIKFADNTFELPFRDNFFQKSGSTLSKVYPSLGYAFESNGRVWGTWGNNTIKASAYNDIKNFSRFEGLSSDSYSINVSTPGEFTGCAAFSSHLVFFKENYIHRIYGNRPSNFSLVTSGAPGVQKGSYESIKMLNERLYYKGVDGVYMYSGGMPVLISECLGTEQYTDAVAGVQGNKYYISMKNSKDEYEMFSYDTIKGVFLKEDNTQLVDTAEYNGKMLYIDENGKLMSIGGSQDRADIEWSAELREFNETVNEKKGYSRLTFRIELDEGAYMNAELAFDNGRFELAKTVSRAGKNIVSINIPPNRCDSFRLRLSGKGGCRVMNMVREFVTGNEVR